MDAAFQAKYLGVARMLWNASEGNPENIPSHYAQHLSYTYADGDISLASLLDRFEFSEELEEQEIEEAIELLGKVSPQDWPFDTDVEGVDVAELLRVYEEAESYEFDYVEDNLGTAEKTEKALSKVISSVFGAEVDNVRSKSNAYPSAQNNFLQEADGTFSGTFKYADHTFTFEIAPTEAGWLCTYRMSEKSLDKLPPVPPEEKKENDFSGTRRVRYRGWN
jgi:hypothetical protein